MTRLNGPVVPGAAPGEPPSLTSVPLVSVAVNAALASIKILAGFFGNSYALIADGIESTSVQADAWHHWADAFIHIEPARR